MNKGTRKISISIIIVLLILVPYAKAKTLIPIIRGKIEVGSEINTDGWKSYDGLVDIGYEKHYGVHRGANEFARGNNILIELSHFGALQRVRLAKFNGIKKEFFHLYLKESEFRYNIRCTKRSGCVESTYE